MSWRVIVQPEQELEADAPGHQVQLQLSFPEDLGDPAGLTAELELMIDRVETNAADERRRTGA